MTTNVDKLLADITATRTFRRITGVSFLGIVDYFNKADNPQRPSFTRARHSQGVLQLGVIAANRINLPMEDASHLFAACLVHDLGHPPFSHSLEYAHPKAERVLSHHMVLREILLAPTGPERDISRVLLSHGVLPERVLSIVEGADPLSFFFTSAINLDTLDGISRSMRSLGFFQKYDIKYLAALIAEIYSGAKISDWRFKNHADEFWKDKDLFYKTISYENSFSRTERSFQAAVRREIPVLTRGHFRMDDRQFCLRYPQIIVEALSGYAVHEQVRSQEFRVDPDILEIDRNTIGSRYVRERYEVRRNRSHA